MSSLDNVHSQDTENKTVEGACLQTAGKITSRAGDVLLKDRIDDSGMKELIANKIQSLQPLPETVVNIDILMRSAEPDNDALLKIIKTDPMVVANILKVSNSAAYGYSGKIKTPSDALRVLGFKIVSKVALSTAINNYLKPDLSPYGIDSVEEFTKISLRQGDVIEKWTDPAIASIKKDLQFAAFLQEIGTIISSMVIIEKNLLKKFREKIAECGSISEAEEVLLGQSSAEITSLVFAKWKFNPSLIEYIRYADKPENATETSMIGSQALKIAKTLVPMNKEGVTPETISKAIELAESYSFDQARFEKLINTSFVIE